MSKLPKWAEQGRAGWRYYGQQRPDFAVKPGPQQESVWDYPRPPRLEHDRRRVIVTLGAPTSAEAIVVADTSAAIRVMETASPPTFYLPKQDIAMDLLEPAGGGSRCEWKGQAQYWNVVAADGRRLDGIGWGYPKPFSEFSAIRDHIAFYPTPLHCTVDGGRVQRQPGRFYGGWITDELVGPFKGEPGSGAW